MAIINIPTKNTGDNLTAAEFNELANAVKSLQGEKGFGFYTDTLNTILSPQLITSGSAVAIQNNKGQVFEPSLPTGVTTLYNGTGITPPSANGQFQAYIAFIGRSSTNNNSFRVSIDIGGTLGEIFPTIETFVKGTNIYQPYSIKINGYMGSTFLANTGIPKIEVTSGTMEIYGASMYVGILSQVQ